MATNSRGQFNSRLGFVLAAAGSAVGLGNIWKFPFEVANGGGAAFVLIYLAFCFLLCFPVMISEIAIGRKTQRNPVGAFKKLGYHNWAWVGLLGVLAGVFILSFYNVVAGWAFGYFIDTVAGTLQLGEQGFSDFTKDWFKVGAYGIVFMVLTAFIVSKGVSGGIEKAAKILMPSLFVMILALMIYGFTLDGAMKGVEFYLLPDFSKLTGDVVYSALGQAFFSLSLGMGALITYGSYVSRQQNIVKSAALITLTDVSIAFIAGLMIFPIVFSFGLNTSSGEEGLVFIALPEVFNTLGPILGVVVGAFFFLLLSFAALTSTVSLLEVPVSYLVDEKKISRPKAVWGTAITIFLLGIPSLTSFGTIDFFTNFISLPGSESPIKFISFIVMVASDTFLPLGGTFIAFFTAYIWKNQNLNAELMLGRDSQSTWILRYINFAVMFFCPIILGAITVITVLERFFGIQVF